jgi:hypothetical protein
VPLDRYIYIYSTRTRITSYSLVKADLIGARVGCHCSDGQLYKGRVESWDKASKEYKIRLDDGVHQLYILPE